MRAWQRAAAAAAPATSTTMRTAAPNTSGPHGTVILGSCPAIRVLLQTAAPALLQCSASSVSGPVAAALAAAPGLLLPLLAV
jgi:hypothetical protein